MKTPLDCLESKKAEENSLTVHDYDEIKEEKKVWDGRAETIQHDVECAHGVRIKTSAFQKSIFQVYRFFKGSGENNSLLDLGCGNGLFTVPLTNIFKNVVGVDISKPMMKRCKEKRSNLNFVVASTTHLPFKDHIFDGVLSVSVLHILRQKSIAEKVVREITRIATISSFIFLTFHETGTWSHAHTNLVKNILKMEKFKLKQNPTSRLSFLASYLLTTRLVQENSALVRFARAHTRYVRLQGSRASARIRI